MQQKKYPISVDLTGKVAVITGAGGVLCSAFAEVLAQAGAKVALLDINEDAVRKVAEHIRAEGGDAVAVRADCLSRESLEEAKAAVDAAFARRRTVKPLTPRHLQRGAERAFSIFLPKDSALSSI